MNIDEFEALKVDPDVVERVQSATFYEAGRAQDPHFSAVWAQVPEAEKEKAREIGFAAIYALVDDYTTPGCDCEYCASGGESGHGKPIMCKQRWDALSVAERMQITESMYG